MKYNERQTKTFGHTLHLFELKNALFKNKNYFFIRFADILYYLNIKKIKIFVLQYIEGNEAPVYMMTFLFRFDFIEGESFIHKCFSSDKKFSTDKLNKYLSYC